MFRCIIILSPIIKKKKKKNHSLLSLQIFKHNFFLFINSTPHSIHQERKKVNKYVIPPTNEEHRLLQEPKVVYLLVNFLFFCFCFLRKILDFYLMGFPQWCCWRFLLVFLVFSWVCNDFLIYVTCSWWVLIIFR